MGGFELIEGTSAPRIVWTEEGRARLAKERGFGAPERLYAGKDAAALHAVLCAHAAKALAAWQAGHAKADPEGQARMRAAFETYAASKEPATLDPEQEGAAAVLLLEEDALAALAEYWIVRGTPAFALDAFARMYSFYRDYDFHGYGETSPTWIKRVDPATNWDSSVSHGPDRMARILCARLKLLGEQGREGARAHGALLRAGAPLTVRAGLARALDDVAWAEEDARAILVGGAPRGDARALATFLRDPALLEAFVADAHYFPARILERAGAGATHVIAKMLPNEDCATVLACIESVDAARAMATLLEKKKLAPMARAYLERRPDLAVLALAPIVAGKGKLATYAEPVLKAVLRARPALAKDMAPHLEARARGALERQGASDEAPEATREELPAALVAPPWTRPRAKKSAPPAMSVPAIEHETKIHWEDGASERILALADSAALNYRKSSPAARTAKLPEGERTPAVDAWCKERFSPGQPWNMVALLHLMSEKAGLERLRDLQWIDHGYALARYGIKALPWIVAVYGDDAERVPHLVTFVGAKELAPAYARALGMKKHKQRAAAWLARFSAAAAAGLVPRALSGTKKQREEAVLALRACDRAKVDAAASRLGDAAARALGELLDAPADEVPDRIPALPAFFDPAAFARPRASGKALPLDAVRVLGTMLALSPLERPLVALAEVKAACDPGSLAEFAWDLFQAWLVAGGPSKEVWAFHAIGHLGDDETARRLTPLVRAWPGESLHARAVTGLDVLAAIGTDVALMHLHGISQKLKFKGLKERAREKIQAIAAARGLTPEELADRLVPDLGLDAAGTMRLDFGPRAFAVTFDETLKPVVVEDGGKRLADLPKPNRSDDPEMSARAVEVWKALKKDARAVAAGQILRLELAMCAGRSWSADELKTFFLEHPLMVHLARRLVWRADDGATFRVAEDRSLATVEDARFELAPGARVGIAHRLDLADEVAARWGQVLGDYEILQPFDQLARATFRPADAERASASCERLKGVTVKTGKVLGLEARGWSRGAPQDAGWIWEMTKKLPAGVIAELSIGGGICAGAADMTPAEQKLGALTLSGASKPTLGALAPAVFSEIVRDLEALRG
jgi:hypothetical protein